MTQYRFPFPLDTITVAYGVVDEDHPNGHRGTDFAPDGGGTVLAVSDGVVVRVEYQSGLGWVMVVRDPDAVFWGLSHLEERPPVEVGARVWIGITPVGDVGDTGTLTDGRHLHFTMSFTSDNPGTGSTFDPIPYITARLSSTAGGGSTPIATTEEDDMNPRVIKKTAKEGAEEWMIVAPWITGPTKKERGYRVTTNQSTGFAWARLYAPAGAPHATLDREDYIKTQDEARVLRDEWIATMKLVNA
ncbi:MAG: M23 family metallopeptidase [Actinobacteria bacterium]|nr:M23 family metallopeptidase [Actinomycetota bacterium]